ncbi:hypothetical protein DP49_4886 [Burkholderia pseudomallei]|nr:hypothetical protein DP49_4886 [Burkholderia pseudomallei]
MVAPVAAATAAPIAEIERQGRRRIVIRGIGGGDVHGCGLHGRRVVAARRIVAVRVIAAGECDARERGGDKGLVHDESAVVRAGQESMPASLDRPHVKRCVKR